VKLKESTAFYEWIYWMREDIDYSFLFRRNTTAIAKGIGWKKSA
jgi:hypothetical protein